jgi:hypothetical protein
MMGLKPLKKSILGWKTCAQLCLAVGASIFLFRIVVFKITSIAFTELTTFYLTKEKSNVLGKRERNLDRICV